MKLTSKHLWGLFAIAILLRLITLGLYPLMDTTEARYGEMARIMWETGNWLTPMTDYDVPFWGKPPMFTWLSAAGIQLMGLSEFAVRMPHWLIGVVTIGICAYFAKRVGINPLVSSVVIATTAVFSISAGAVMTDMAMTVSLAFALVGFYLCWQGDQKWGYIGFIALGFALLSKGPVTIVIFGLAAFPFLVIQHGLIGAFRELWQRFPLIKGLALMSIVAVPWYIMAERATPGFLDYFIIGEHYLRFTVPGWDGDLYGNAHDEPRGIIWWFWIQAAAPWSISLILMSWTRRTQIKEFNAANPGLLSFLVCWMISPMILFTFAGNILPAYVLPGTPAVGLLMACLIRGDEKWFTKVALIVPALLIFAVIFIGVKSGEERSDKAVFADYEVGVPVYYVGSRPFSGQYYSEGNAVRYKDPEDLRGHENGYYLAGRPHEIERFLPAHNLQEACTLENGTERRQLVRCK
ncbi:glycosyltransferase family 39 protein [Vibrio sp. SCSIO 43136]|uniref:ArnT family glycosyltransferase n=1 Tax=Vibrio sp. SCSIO 43136 TaxID=2819101 RepID=UPI002074EDD7|nr:glycosyltransferase family 39 protein [Vibrio sp. SCSIO 43136]